MRRFAFRLALQLGCTVNELFKRISVREFVEWMEYYKLEPFGEERADLRSGIIASTMANLTRGKGTRALTPEDFMPVFEAKQKPSASLYEMFRAAFPGKKKK